jgi:hypothetical protein
MRLLEKYEILELLASGSISTFLARDRTTQVEVVVHSFECPNSATGGTRDRTIFKRFSSMAPPPAGRVLDVGLDEATALAYIVTHVPPPSTLQDWIHSYRANNIAKHSPDQENPGAKIDAAGEITNPNSSPIIGQTFSAEPLAAQAAEPLPVAGFNPVAPKGEFTKLFEGIGSAQPNHDQDSSTSVSETITSNRLDNSLRGVSQPERGAGEKIEAKPAVSNTAGFTELFVLGRKDSPLLGEPGLPGLDESATSAPEQPGEFTREFMGNAAKADPNAGDKPNSNFNPAKQPARGLPDFSLSSTFELTTHAEAPAETPKNSTSDFTNFFRGPFDQPGVPNKLDPSFSALTPKEKSVGEFTKIFGSSNSQQPEIEESEPKASTSPPGDFTKLFSRDDERGAQLGLTSRLNADPNPAEQMPKPARSVEPIQKSPSFTLENKSSILAPPLEMGLASGTTNFAPPVIPLERASANLRGSVFPDATEVFKPPQNEDGFSQELPSGPSDFTKFLSRSQIDASLSKEPPLPPPVPRVTPKPPSPASLMPKPPKQAATAASYWPLITVLTVLVAIAAMLLMYFVMRH